MMSSNELNLNEVVLNKNNENMYTCTHTHIDHLHYASTKMYIHLNEHTSRQTN